jgi:KUP system potassium uptake protein
MHVDNQGEGGILALMSRTGADWAGRGRALIVLGLLGAALVYGDGIITPAISVLSAVEGLNVATSMFKPYTMPIALVILAVLFAIQHRGTGVVGRPSDRSFVWFATIAILALLVLCITHMFCCRKSRLWCSTPDASRISWVHRTGEYFWH